MPGHIEKTANASRFEQSLANIAEHDVATLVQKDAEYGSSWKKRGGVGAFMMLARKWDRLETQVTRSSLDSKYDIFDAIEQEARDHIDSNNNPTMLTESTLETIRDLRRYLLLVESEIVLRKEVDRGGTTPNYSSEHFGDAEKDPNYGR